MQLAIILRLFTILISLSFVLAAEGFMDYIITLSKPVTKDKIARAKADIEKLGGKVNFEITLGVHALAVSLPSNQFQTLQEESYIDFIEEDKLGKKFQVGS